MRIVRAAEGVGDAVGEVLDREEAVGFEDAAFAVDPGRFDGIEPGALDRQEAGDDADAGTGVLDLSVVIPDPGADVLTDVPRRIVPDQAQGLLAVRLELGAAP